jgi:Ni/Fe-hydrogenase subunit HybB-like protein
MERTATAPDVRGEFKRFIRFLLSEMKPKGKLITPFNVFATITLVTAAVILTIRFWKGLGAVTNFSPDYPWGIWVAFNVITGVAFAGGAYVLTFMVYILHLKKYKPIVRVTVLNGFLAYVFYAGALVLDLGKPWHIINPIIGHAFGLSSVLFLVAWHFLLYMTAEFIEFSPAVAEWLGWKRVHKVLESMTLAAVIFGITLSTLHQSGLGALFLMAKPKIHPLWYSEFIPILFLVSSIFAGLSMIILERTISNRVFRKRTSAEIFLTNDAIHFGLAKICAVTMFVYLFMKIIVLVHGQHLSLLTTSWGLWYLVEVVGFVLIPGLLFTQSVRTQNINLVRIGAIMTILGIILNRLNTSLIAFNWTSTQRYFPTWMELEVAIAILVVQVLVFRWIVNRMPILSDPPRWAQEPEEAIDNRPIKIEEEQEKWKVSIM